MAGDRLAAIRMLDVLTAIHRRNQRGYRPTADDIADEVHLQSAEVASELGVAVDAGLVQILGSHGFDETYALTEAGRAEELASRRGRTT